MRRGGGGVWDGDEAGRGVGSRGERKNSWGGGKEEIRRKGRE